MKTFKLDPCGFKEIRQKTLLRTIPIAVLAALAGLYISSVNQNTGTSSLDTLPIVIPIMIVALCFGIFSGLKRQKDMWDTYELTIDGETISRTQNNVPTVTIKKDDLQEIVESPQGHILLKTGNRTNLINIPSSVQDRDELLNTLAGFGQINKEVGNKSNLTLFISLAGIGLMLVFFVSKDKSIILLTGTILTGGLLWAFFEIQKSKLIDKKTKRGAYFIFLVLFSIIGRLLMELKIFGT